jgi:hypothetical protein
MDRCLGFVPPILAIARSFSRLPGRTKDDRFRRMKRLCLLALSALPVSFLLLKPCALWPWTTSPLAARAVASWLAAFGVACGALALENDIKHGAGTSSSCVCVLQLVVFARYASAIDWGNHWHSPTFFLVLGLLISKSARK